MRLLLFTLRIVMNCDDDDDEDGDDDDDDYNKTKQHEELKSLYFEYCLISTPELLLSFLFFKTYFAQSKLGGNQFLSRQCVKMVQGKAEIDKECI